jgi:benzoyl-CoA reductase/2-hydroxyglutaryl-CoA dehydratase subunit BcrC/BadD/HgdB
MCHSAIKEWKQGGGRVIGTTCLALPEEVMWAAGIVPVKLRAPGVGQTPRATGRIHRISCSYSRALLETIIGEAFSFLDGIVVTCTCDHQLRLAAEIENLGLFPFVHYFRMPHTLSKGGRDWYLMETRKLIAHMEASFNLAVSSSKLTKAIATYNRLHTLMDRLHELRRNHPPPITGTDYLKIALAGVSTPRDRCIRELEALLHRHRPRQAVSRNRPRIMLIGSACDSSDLYEFIESRGCTIVVEGICGGYRQYGTGIDIKYNDPVEAITNRHFARIPLPTVQDGMVRLSRELRELIERYAVDGVISAPLKFCDPWAGARIMLSKELKSGERFVPVLDLEREYTLTGTGQMSTRIQAFLEMI